jgi:hypothetical protein
MRLIAIGRVIVFWALACAAPVLAVATDNPATSAEPLQQEQFTVDDRPAFVIRPTKTAPGPIPWVMYAPTLAKRHPGDAESWMFRRFLARGIAIAGVDVGESFGSPAGRKTYSALHERLVSKDGFDKRACLLARSRGGLMLYAWAADNPDKVKCIAGIYPVCNLSSYPGLKRASKAFAMTEAELAKLPPNMRRTEICDRKRPPVYVELDLDGETVYNALLQPSGIAGDGPSRVYQRFVLPVGSHDVAIRLRDTTRTEGFDYAAERRISLVPMQSFAIDFRPSAGGFIFNE